MSSFKDKTKDKTKNKTKDKEKDKEKDKQKDKQKDKTKDKEKDKQKDKTKDTEKDKQKYHKYKKFGTLLRSSNKVIDNEAKNLFLPSDFEKPKLLDFLDGRILWKDYLTPIYDQKQVSGCYAFATVSCLSDAYALQTLLQVKPFFNPLELLACYKIIDTAYYYFDEINDKKAFFENEKKIVSDIDMKDTLYTMAGYLFRDGAIEDSCISIKHVQDIIDKTGTFPLCSDIEGPELIQCTDVNIPERSWTVTTAYTLEGTGKLLIENIKYDIMKWGPLVAAFNVFPDFLYPYDGKTLYIPKSNQKSLGGHSIKIVGWGTENSVPYWLCANSWGTDWGDEGYFKIVQNNTDLDLEINHMSLWPFIYGVEIIPYTRVNGLISKKNISQRKYNNIDPITFYTDINIKLIKEGKIPGDLKPVINIATVPLTTDFFAFNIGKTNFLTFGGTYISSMSDVDKKTIDKHNTAGIIFLLFLGVIMFIVLTILLRKCYKRERFIK
jgi:uncharacterized membrane protein YccF (DUF307 family)